MCPPPIVDLVANQNIEAMFGGNSDDPSSDGEDLVAMVVESPSSDDEPEVVGHHPDMYEIDPDDPLEPMPVARPNARRDQRNRQAEGAANFKKMYHDLGNKYGLTPQNAQLIIQEYHHLAQQHFIKFGRLQIGQLVHLRKKPMQELVGLVCSPGPPAC